MKKSIILTFLAVSLGFCSCHNGNSANQANQTTATVETFGGTGAGLVAWAPESKLMAWDKTFATTEATVASVADDTLSCILQFASDAAPAQGSSLVYPANAYAGQGAVCIPATQQGNFHLSNIIYYAQLHDGQTAFKAIGGIFQLHLTTPERLTSVTLSTADSNHYMAGPFQVADGTCPVLNPTEKSQHQIIVDNIENIDFSQGNDLFVQMAPGSFHSFQVVMQNVDGKKCTKTLKNEKVIEVERNQIAAISLGDSTNVLLFE